MVRANIRGMDLRLDRDSQVPLFRQVYAELRRRILAGALPEGFRLPPERRLADALRVTRGTILAAYRELKADGLVDAHVGRGTAVLAPPRGREAEGPTTRPAPPAWRQLLRSGASNAQEPLLRDLLGLSERTDVISLAIGLPAPELLPLDILRKTWSAAVEQHGAPMFLHSPTEGVSAFRETLAAFVAPRGIEASADEILVTSGAQQGLDLVARTFIDPGDVVIVEEPTYCGILPVLRTAQARIVSVPVDADGMRVDLLDAVLERQRAKLIYTLPTFQNPSGAVLSLERRRRLLEIAYRHRVPILEDDVYFELRYDGEPLPSLKALDDAGYVLHLSSLSKALFPGLRLGFFVAPRAVVRQLCLAKQSIDLHTNTVGQFLVDRLVRDGHYDRHIRRLRKAYAHRRDTMDDALRRAKIAGLQWERPAGGFYFWCRVPGGIAASRLLAAAAQAGVAYLPGEACFADEPTGHFVRLNFSFPGEAEIREGVKRFASALRRAAAEPPSRARAAKETTPIV